MTKETEYLVERMRPEIFSVGDGSARFSVSVPAGALASAASGIGEAVAAAERLEGEGRAAFVRAVVDDLESQHRALADVAEEVMSGEAGEARRELPDFMPDLSAELEKAIFALADASGRTESEVLADAITRGVAVLQEAQRGGLFPEPSA